MSEIALISCSKTKKSEPTRAALLYDSPLFRKSLLYAFDKSDTQYILSAKHSVLSLDDFVEPYELALKNLTRAQRVDWSNRVLGCLRNALKPGDELIFLCGRDYYQLIVPALRAAGHKVRLPLEDLSLGIRLRALSKLNREGPLLRVHSDFYGLLKDLYVGQGGGRLLKECDGKMSWPKRGLYFFFEPDEKLSTRRFAPLLQRVTRVGTHAVSKESKSTLWNRLSTHRGGMRGTGNHRSSIFRLHVGAALARRNPALHHASWGIGSAAPSNVRNGETTLEHEVSRFLGETRVLWLDIPDEAGPKSDRAYLERNAIGILSRNSIIHGAPAKWWLGLCSPNINIALSGLWNLNYLYSQPDPHFVEVFAAYVSSTLGKSPAPTKSIAPASWYASKIATDSNQLTLTFDDSTKAATNS